jgi:hypothetical protein
MPVPCHTTILFSSDPSQGASPLGTDGSRFEVDMDTPVTLGDPDGLGRRATVVEVAVTRAAVWNVSPNISPEDGFRNNQFPFVSAGTSYLIEVPTGLYSLTALDGYLSQQFVNLGLSPNLFRLGASDATQSAIIIFEDAGSSVDFRTIAGGGQSDSTLRTILGFDAALFTAPSAGFAQAGSSEAAFNRVNSYLISTTTMNGLIVNRNSTGVLTQVPIDAPPGSQIVYQPVYPVWFSAPELLNSGRQKWTFALTDQAGRATPTLGEYWSFVLSIRYHLVTP